MSADDPPSLRVMVVDDTAAIRWLMRLNLECEGHQVVEAEDGEAALATLRDPAVPRPDVLTLDLEMAPRGGWWLLSELRADPELVTLPVVVMTASVQEQQRVRANRTGADAFVTKPFEPDDVLAVLVALGREGRRGGLAPDYAGDP